ncbi:MAG: sulfotransferase [Candidatus Limnocylindrales bacterium]
MTRIPDTFIIGAPKSGTTSLYVWLSGHPQVFMTPVKEPCYYSRDLSSDKSGNFMRFGTDRQRYLALFDGAGSAERLGEASTRYLYSEEAPQLIAADSPDARVIALLRNPIDFIASLHAHKLAGGTEDLESLENALDAEADRHAGKRIPRDSNPHLATYRDRARFGEQLPRWIEKFGRERVHVIVFEEMVADPSRHFRQVLEFLDVDPDYAPAAFSTHNPAHSSSGGVMRTVLRAAPVQFVAWRLLPAVVGDVRARSLAQRMTHSKLRRKAAPRAQVSPELRSRLQAELAPDVARLSEILGRDMNALWFGPAEGSSDVAASASTPDREAVGVS